MERLTPWTLILAAGLALSLVPLALLAQETPLERAREKANRAKCANSLRRLGLAALQYADDKRFFPHVNPLRELDGDVNSNHTPKTVRTLHWYDYHDSPEGWICETSEDQALEVKAVAKAERMKWFWKQDYEQASTTQSPIVHGDDPKLSETRELSYGWTRKAMNSNTRSTTLVAADRAVREKADGKGPLAGNHKGGWNVLQADCTVSWRRVDQPAFEGGPLHGKYLSATEKGSGYLAIKPQPDAEALAADPMDQKGRK